MRRIFWTFCVALLLAPAVWAAEVIPPSPERYIVDQANVLSQKKLDEINVQLTQFEQETTSQVVVAIYPRMESQDAIAAYAVRVFKAWKIGQRGKDNGVLLLIFTQDRKLNITTGYGMEGPLPDATAHAIIERDITPRFKAGDYNGGVQAGVDSIIAATRGEFKAPATQPAGPVEMGLGCCVFLLFVGVPIFVIYLIVRAAIRTGKTFSSRGFGTFSGGRSSSWGGGRSSGWGSSGSSGGGWSSGSSGGGFSGGGGRTGGGGASGSW